MSWVAIDDVVGAIAYALAHERVAGPVNVTAPGAVTQAEYAARSACAGPPGRAAGAGVRRALLLGEFAQRGAAEARACCRSGCGQRLCVPARGARAGAAARAELGVHAEVFARQVFSSRGRKNPPTRSPTVQPAEAGRSPGHSPVQHLLEADRRHDRYRGTSVRILPRRCERLHPVAHDASRRSGCQASCPRRCRIRRPSTDDREELAAGGDLLSARNRTRNVVRRPPRAGIAAGSGDASTVRRSQPNTLSARLRSPGRGPAAAHDVAARVGDVDDVGARAARYVVAPGPQQAEGIRGRSVREAVAAAPAGEPVGAGPPISTSPPPRPIVATRAALETVAPAPARDAVVSLQAQHVLGGGAARESLGGGRAADQARVRSGAAGAASLIERKRIRR